MPFIRKKHNKNKYEILLKVFLVKAIRKADEHRFGSALTWQLKIFNMKHFGRFTFDVCEVYLTRQMEAISSVVQYSIQTIILFYLFSICNCVPLT